MGCFDASRQKEQLATQNDTNAGNENEVEILPSKNVQDLVDIVNRFDSDEVKYAFNHDLARNDHYVVNGETVARIETCQEKANKLGFSIVWDCESQTVIAVPVD